MSQTAAEPTKDIRFYDFGPFRVDAVNRLLLRDKEIVPLTSKVFDILLVFVSNSGRMLNKEDLMKQVWPESFVEEGNLTRNVSTLRKALGESPQQHQYIITVPGRGYRFVARVMESEDESSALIVEEHSLSRVVIEHDEEEPGTSAGDLVSVAKETFAVAHERRVPASSKLRKVLPLVATCLLAVVLLAVYRYATSKPHPSTSFSQIEFTSLTSTGDVYAPTISPDGKYLAYSSLEPGGFGLRVRQVATGSIVQLVPAGPKHCWGISFSRDSNYVYFIIGDDGTNSGVLYRVPALGGHAQKLLHQVNGGPAMSPDGRRLAFKRYSAAPARTTLLVAGVDGSDEHTIAILDPSSDYQSFDWSPDNKTIACVLRDVSAAGQSWYVAEIPSEGGSEKLILPKRKTQIVQSVWMPDHSGLIMNAIDPVTHVAQLSFVSYPGGEERRISNDLSNYKAISVTADGRTIVAEKMGSISQLWIAPTSDPSRGRLLLTTASLAYHCLSWAPDEQLVFDAEESGTFDIWKMSKDGTGRERLTFQQGRNIAPSITPDGRYIVFISTRTGSPQLWRMDVDGNNPKQLTASPDAISEPQCAPDGKWVFYTTYLEGRWKLWKTPLDGGESSEVIDSAVEYWGISPDGKQLAYSYRDQEFKKTRIAVVSLAGGKILKHFELEPDRFLQWAKDGSGLGYIARDNENIWVQPIAGGRPKQVTNLQPVLRLIKFAWSNDGQQLAYTRGVHTFDAVALSFK